VQEEIKMKRKMKKEGVYYGEYKSLEGERCPLCDKGRLSKGEGDFGRVKYELWRCDVCKEGVLDMVQLHALGEKEKKFRKVKEVIAVK